MAEQFSDLSVPDPNKYYYCSWLIKSRNWTHLMKLVLMANNIDAVNLIKKIITNNPEEINKQNEAGWSALMIASRNSTTCSSIEVVKLLLEAGSDPNLQDNAGTTALIWVYSHSDRVGKIEIVKLLLEAGSDPNLHDKNGRTALYYFLVYGNLEQDMEHIEQLILASQKSIPNNGSFYDIYLVRNVDILDDYYIRILKGEIVVNKTKSARN